MGYWKYTNIGASSTHSNNIHIQSIFEYMGYVSRQDLKYENGRTFEKPDVYYCMRDVHPSFNSVKSKFKDMDGYGFEDLRNLLNALFPGTVMSLFTSDGDNIKKIR